MLEHIASAAAYGMVLADLANPKACLRVREVGEDHAVCGGGCDVFKHHFSFDVRCWCAFHGRTSPTPRRCTASTSSLMPSRPLRGQRASWRTRADTFRESRRGRVRG